MESGESSREQKKGKEKMVTSGRITRSTTRICSKMENESTKSVDEEYPIILNHLIERNVLTRLPVKSVIRFKTVCKHWLSAISSPKFAKIHLNLSPPSPQKLLLFLYNRIPPRRIASITIDECSGLKEVTELEFKYKCRDIYIVGSANGLVCFHDKHGKYCLWNPATSCYHYFNGPPSSNDSYNLVAIGLGHVSSIDDCRIVCLVASKPRKFVEVYFFSLGDPKWERKGSCDDIGFEINHGEACVTVNGMLYWPPVWNCWGVCFVVGVNMVSGQIIKIPLVNLRYRSTFTRCCGCPRRMKLFWMEGRLTICVIDNINHMPEVWTLMRDGCSWLKLYQFNNLRGIDVLYLTEDRKFLLMKKVSQELLLLDPNEIHNLKFEGGIHFDGCHYIASPSTLEYRETLVSPIPSAKNKAKVGNRVVVDGE